MKHRYTLLLLAAVLLLGGCVCFAQDAAYDTIAPLRANAFADSVYVGFDHIRTDYALVTPTGNELAETSGVNVEFDMRRKEHIAYIATVRYGMGSPFSEGLATGAAGASYLFHLSRFEPYVHLMGGYSRLASNHPEGGMYLANVNTGAAVIFGGGLDVRVKERWSVRVISLEDIYLPFGQWRSSYWSVGAGAIYHFGSRRAGR